MGTEQLSLEATTLPRRTPLPRALGKSPIVIDDLVYIANDSQAESAIVALDRRNGEVRWHIPRESGITAFATPCVLDPAASEKLLLAVSTASGLTAIRAKTGEVAW